MICSHCLIAFKEVWNNDTSKPIYDNIENLRFYVFSTTCPECTRTIIKMYVEEHDQLTNHWNFKKSIFIHPKTPSRKPISKTIPKEFTKDYFEAIAVIEDSPNASAALSRRALQHILEEKSKVTKGDRLVDQIKEAKENERFDLMVNGLLDYVRKFGNFGAHASKDDNDKIINVEQGESETMIEIIESLLDYYFVKPEELKIIQKKLDEKIQQKKIAKKSSKPIPSNITNNSA